jgi:hypothetical protein
VNFDQGFAAKGVLLMWLGAIAVVVYKENLPGANNPDRPLPRPCKLIPPSLGYTGLGLLAQFLPTVALVVAVGLTVTEVVQENPLTTNVFQQLAESVSQTNRSVAAAA